MLQLDHISLKKQKTQILSGVNFAIHPGEKVAIVGKSGAGKSSLFRLLTGAEIPSEGEIFLDDIRLNALNQKNIQRYRRQLGMVFQDYKLLPHKNVIENVAFPLIAMGETKNIRSRSETALHAVGLLPKANEKVQVLSGGERQRVAIARALVHDPKILLADEPTGNLDPKTTQEIAEIFNYLHTAFNLTILVSTHDENFLKALKPRVLKLERGKITAT